MFVIPLSGLKGKGRYILLDKCDYKWAINCVWYLSSHGYAWRSVTNSNGLKIVSYLHKEILPGLGLVDHRNRRKLDCRRQNLRIVSKLENVRNTSKQPKRKFEYVGVYPKDDGYRVQVNTNKKHSLYYGKYKDKKIAALVADEVRRRLWNGEGEGLFNFPDERLPEGFKILNLDFKKVVLGITWDSWNGNWKAAYKGKSLGRYIFKEDALLAVAQAKSATISP